MQKNTRLIAVSLLGVLLLSAGLYSTKASAVVSTFENVNPDFSNERTLSSSELKDLQQSVSAINTEYGIFTRSDEKIESPHVVYDIDSIDSQTKQVVTEYGVFIKE